MSTTTPDVNYWHDRRCAKAFWAQDKLQPYRELLADTAAWLDPAAGEHWLDLGCGSGRLTRTLWEKSGGTVGAVVAVDCAAVNERAIASLRDSLQPSVSPDRISFRHIDFSNGLEEFAGASFDGVVSGLSIQYAQSWSEKDHRWTTRAYDRVLGEVNRVLRPGGRFIFSVNVPNPSWLRIALHGVPDFFTSAQPIKYLRDSMRMLSYGKWLKDEASRGRFHYLPEDAVLARLERAGFVRLEHRLSYARQAYLFRAYKPLKG